MEFHPVANIFPVMAAQELKELQDDIAQNGLLEPIWVYEGQILDGRNRYLACQHLNLDPKVKIYQGSTPIEFILNRNLHRRHLTVSRKVAIAVEALPYSRRRRGSDRRMGRRPPGERLVPKMGQALEEKPLNGGKVSSGHPPRRGNRCSRPPASTQRTRTACRGAAGVPGDPVENTPLLVVLIC